MCISTYMELPLLFQSRTFLDKKLLYLVLLKVKMIKITV